MSTSTTLSSTMIRSVPALSTTPVVILSCSDDETLVNQCMQNGANAFVPKSAGFDDFHAQVSRIGHFWAGDCFARRSISPQTGEFPMACSDDVAARDSDRFEKHLGGTDRAKRILLADDDAGHVTLIKRAIRRADIDCTVDVVHNGAEAIDYLFGAGERADRQPGEIPDLMLLDLNMPEMNGRQVLQVLRNVGSSQERLRLPPVVVLTSSDLDTDVNDSYSLGAKSFIRKSVDQGQFAQAVQQTTQYWLGLNRPLSGTTSRPMCLPR